MRSRAIQLGMLVALGVTLGLLLTRGWREAPAVPAPAVATAAPKIVITPSPAPPAARAFKLPAMRPPVATTEASGTPPEDPVAATVVVPKYWLLRGTSPQSYDISADRQQVHNGEVSVRIKAHDKDISPTLTGSVMQNVVAQSLLGRRLEVSAFLRAEDVRERTVTLWFMAMDPRGRLLVSESSGAQYPKIGEQWIRVQFVVDVPPIAAELNYGVTLKGKGTAWVDDLRLTTVNPDVVEITGAAFAKQLGQPISPASDREALPRPENLDFEETEEITPALLREKRPESLTEIRY